MARTDAWKIPKSKNCHKIDKSLLLFTSLAQKVPGFVRLVIWVKHKCDVSKFSDWPDEEIWENNEALTQELPKSWMLFTWCLRSGGWISKAGCRSKKEITVSIDTNGLSQIKSQ